MDAKEERLARETFPMLPARIVAAVWKAGYRSPEQLGRATDEELMDVQGIDVRGLAHVRAALASADRPSE